ncbi:uncharacterized protein UBRO_20358 [Ustilago bromivora]|uniref:Uncharacterized protein n=1 Tax=Ustilago bromivora TaxID=307758 RepID=A0A1K0GBY5_9BASI|nr:uncharacterized protein UBRO_20358 [Ustilago bromivora]SYW80502.1 uncharacterized protein UBRO2_03770 [Ustilago bromivora]
MNLHRVEGRRRVLLAKRPGPSQPSRWRWQPETTATDGKHLTLKLDEQVETISQLAVSISELHHLVLALRHDLSTSKPPPTTIPSSSPPAPAPPTAPTPTAAQPFPGPVQPSGELQLRRLFPWISKEVAQLVYDDRLPLHDLGKLRNTAKVPTSKDAEPGVLVNGVRVTVLDPTGRAQGDGWGGYEAVSELVVGSEVVCSG